MQFNKSKKGSDYLGNQLTKVASKKASTIWFLQWKTITQIYRLRPTSPSLDNPWSNHLIMIVMKYRKSGRKVLMILRLSKRLIGKKPTCKKIIIWEFLLVKTIKMHIGKHLHLERGQRLTLFIEIVIFQKDKIINIRSKILIKLSNCYMLKFKEISCFQGKIQLH
jgi:hypothetical protein